MRGWYKGPLCLLNRFAISSRTIQGSQEVIYTDFWGILILSQDERSNEHFNDRREERWIDCLTARHRGPIVTCLHCDAISCDG